MAKANPEVPNMDGPPQATDDQVQLDAAAVRAAMAAAGDQDVVETFVKLVTQAGLNDGEIELLNEAAKRSGTSRRTVTKMLRTAQHELAAERQREAEQRALAERNDPRPRIDVPAANAPWLLVMSILEEVIGPAPRDIQGHKRISVGECAEMIERYIEFVDKKGRSVRLPTKFVRHYLETRVR
jgi:hypothetical protein